MYAAFARATQQLPRMTQQVEHTARRAGASVGGQTHRFALGNEMRVSPAPGDGCSWRRFSELPPSRATERFPPAHPLWDATLYGGVEASELSAGAESSPCCRRRGSPARTCSRSSSNNRKAEPAPACSPSPQPPVRIPVPRPVPTPLDSVEDLTCNEPHLSRGSTRSSGAVLPVLPFGRITYRRRRCRTSVEYVKSAREPLIQGDAKPSRLLRGRSLRRQLHTHGSSTGSDAPGGSLEIKRLINDVYLAALLEGLALYVTSTVNRLVMFP